jgi:hypothetical protein
MDVGYQQHFMVVNPSKDNVPILMDETVQSIESAIIHFPEALRMPSSSCSCWINGAGVVVSVSMFAVRRLFLTRNIVREITTIYDSR